MGSLYFLHLLWLTSGEECLWFWLVQHSFVINYFIKNDQSYLLVLECPFCLNVFFARMDLK